MGLCYSADNPEPSDKAPLPMANKSTPPKGSEAFVRGAGRYASFGFRRPTSNKVKTPVRSQDDGSIEPLLRSSLRKPGVVVSKSRKPTPTACSPAPEHPVSNANRTPTSQFGFKRLPSNSLSDDVLNKNLEPVNRSSSGNISVKSNSSNSINQNLENKCKTVISGHSQSASNRKGKVKSGSVTVSSGNLANRKVLTTPSPGSNHHQHQVADSVTVKHSHIPKFHVSSSPAANYSGSNAKVRTNQQRYSLPPQVSCNVAVPLQTSGVGNAATSPYCDSRGKLSPKIVPNLSPKLPRPPQHRANSVGRRVAGSRSATPGDHSIPVGSEVSLGGESVTTSEVERRMLVSTDTINMLCSLAQTPLDGKDVTALFPPGRRAATPATGGQEFMVKSAPQTPADAAMTTLEGTLAAVRSGQATTTAPYATNDGPLTKDLVPRETLTTDCGAKRTLGLVTARVSHETVATASKPLYINEPPLSSCVPPRPCSNDISSAGEQVAVTRSAVAMAGSIADTDDIEVSRRQQEDVACGCRDVTALSHQDHPLSTNRCYHVPTSPTAAAPTPTAPGVNRVTATAISGAQLLRKS